MANGFDPRGAAVAVTIIVVGALVVAAVTLPIFHGSIKLDLPPVKAAAK
jgi:hypothetical protein